MSERHGLTREDLLERARTITADYQRQGLSITLRLSGEEGGEE